MKLLAHVYSFTGLAETNEPDKAGTTIHLKHLKNVYGNLSMVEVVTAFTLSSEGKIECELKHFQTFSPVYLSGVLNAYIEYRRKAVALINKERMELEVAKPKPTPEQQLEIDKRMYYNCIAKADHDYLKTGKVDVGHVSSNHVYECMEKDLKILHTDNMEKKILYQKVSEELPRKMAEKISEMPKSTQQKDFRNTVRKAFSGEDDKTKNRLIQEECRFIIIRNFFQSHKAKNLSMNDTLGLTEWLKGKI